jgi:flagellar basal body-associated protein FliL
MSENENKKNRGKWITLLILLAIAAAMYASIIWKISTKGP